MRKIVEKKGITLIALVITIIVLLILAGITINLTIGQDGIISKAQEAEKKTQEGEEIDKQILAGHENKIGQYIDGTRNFSTINFSTNEQDTGRKWVNDKKIYQKTIIMTVAMGDVAEDVSDLNIEQLVEINGVCSTSDQIQNLTNYHYNIPGLGCWYMNNKVTIRCNEMTNLNGCTAYITIQYTKTTD